MKFWLKELKQEKLKFKTFPTSESNPAIGLILKLNILASNLPIHCRCSTDVVKMTGDLNFSKISGGNIFSWCQKRCKSEKAGSSVKARTNLRLIRSNQILTGAKASLGNFTTIWLGGERRRRNLCFSQVVAGSSSPRGAIVSAVNYWLPIISALFTLYKTYLLTTLYTMYISILTIASKNQNNKERTALNFTLLCKNYNLNLSFFYAETVSGKFPIWCEESYDFFTLGKLKLSEEFLFIPNL